MRITECGQGKVGVRYEKDGEEGWTPLVRRKMSARTESGDSSCDLDVDGGNLVEYRCFGSQEFISTGEIPDEAVVCCEAHPALFLK